MNTYLREFLQADFSPWRPAQVYHSTDAAQSELPVAEIAGFDLSKLADAERLIRAMTDEFLRVTSQELFRHWWNQDVRSQGWTELSIIDLEDGVRLVHDLTQTVLLPPKQPCENQELKNVLLDVLQGLPILKLTVLRLEPNGWIQPHMDTMRDASGLAYFWMPLHDFPPCLKIWPYGWLHHKTGSMYLLNYSKYVHAAVNHTDQDRFVLSGRLDLSSLPDWFIEQLTMADQNHQNLWSTSSACQT